VIGLLRKSGWKVNKKRVERIWRREGLKVTTLQPKQDRLWMNNSSCIRLRPERSNHVRAYDIVAYRTNPDRTVEAAKTGVSSHSALGYRQSGLKKICFRGIELLNPCSSLEIITNHVGIEIYRFFVEGPLGSLFRSSAMPE